MPSVASDLTSVFPPPPRANPLARAANDSEGEAASPFADMVDRSASERSRQNQDRPDAPARSRSERSQATDDGQNAGGRKGAGRKTDSARGDKPDHAPEKNDATDQTGDPLAAAMAETTPPAVSTPTGDAVPVAAANTDTAGQAFAAAVAQVSDLQTAVDATDKPAAAKGDQPAAGDTQPDTAAKPQDKPADKAAAEKTATSAAASGAAAPDVNPAQPNTPDPAAVVIAEAVQAQTTPGPKTSVPQIPRAIAATDAKAATTPATGAPGQQAKGAADSPDDATPAQGAKTRPADHDDDQAAATNHVVRRAERFSDVLAADSKTRSEPAPAIGPDPSAGLPAPQALAQTPPAVPAALPVAGAPATAHAVPLDGVAVEITARAGEGQHRFEICLDPPELGRIEVRLDVDRNGQVVSHITADRGDTLDLLRRDSANLERALQDAGLKTGDNGLQFSLRDQGFARHQQANDTGERARLVASDTSIPTITPREYRASSGRAGGVDIRV